MFFTLTMMRVKRAFSIISFFWDVFYQIFCCHVKEISSSFFFLKIETMKKNIIFILFKINNQVFIKNNSFMISCYALGKFSNVI